MLIYDGKILHQNIKKSKLSVNDLISLAREKGYFDIAKIKYAIFENSGNLSIMPIDENATLVAKDFGIKKNLHFPYYLICDGKISFSGLSALSKDKVWLFERMGIKKKKKI